MCSVLDQGCLWVQKLLFQCCTAVTFLFTNAGLAIVQADVADALLLKPFLSANACLIVTQADLMFLNSADNSSCNARLLL